MWSVTLLSYLVFITDRTQFDQSWQLNLSFEIERIHMISHIVFVRNPRVLRSHALDHVGCTQIYPRLSKSIAMDKQVFKNNKNAIENIDL